MLKLEYDIRRNASTNVRKTYLIDRYILHWKPKHTIYVRYFSILLLYLLNVQVAPTENKTSLKLWWRISLNVLSWQDSETRPGAFVIFMLSITIEKEDFDVNCLYKTRWDSYPGIGKGKQILFIKKKLAQLFTHLFFWLNIQKQHTEASYTCHHSECEKTGHIFNRKKLWAFNRVPSYVF